jgi:hypothetical protein
MKAKLAGLLTEKIEVGPPGSFDNCDTTVQIVDRMLERVIEQFAPVDEADRQGLIDLCERHMAETGEYLAAIKARPIAAERVDIRNLKIPWQQLQRYSAQSQFKITHRGNGTSRP